MRRIRVTQVLEATVGGTGKHLRYLATRLDPGRFEVSVICSLQRDPAYGQVLQQMRDAGVRVEIVPMVREVSPLADWRAYWEIRRLVRRLKPDIVHAHSSKAGFLARMAAHSLGVRATLYTPHCFAFQMEADPLRLTAYRRLERMAGKWTTRLIAVSSEERKLAVKARICPEERVTVLFNGLDLHELDDQLPREQARRELGVSPRQLVVGAVGRLCAQKAPQDFVHAAGQVALERGDIRFVWIGGGELEQSMRRLASSYGRELIVFAGQRPDAVSLYSAFDVFVVCSRWEGCPYSALEAGASGLPIVSTAVGGMQDIVVDGMTGLLVPPRRPEHIARAIINIFSNDARREAMGQTGRERIRDQFSLERHIKRMQDLYEEVAAG